MPRRTHGPDIRIRDHATDRAQLERAGRAARYAYHLANEQGRGRKNKKETNRGN